jgi:hypothetical protein
LDLDRLEQSKNQGKEEKMRVSQSAAVEASHGRLSTDLFFKGIENNTARFWLINQSLFQKKLPFPVKKVEHKSKKSKTTSKSLKKEFL